MLEYLKFVKIYLDDILVHSQTIKEHFYHLQTVFKILHSNNAAINFSKSIFCSDKVSYLGQNISSDGIRPDIKRIISFKIPTIKYKRDLQRLIGFLNWFRPFIRDFAKKMYPLYEKLKSSSKFSLNNSEEPTIL